MSRITHTSKSRGFSLIELMVGITLGMLIMTALVTLFVNTSHSNRELAKVNGQIENGRFVMQLLQNEIVHGGFWGGFIPQFDDITLSPRKRPDHPTDPEPITPADVPTAIPAPCRIYDPASPWNGPDKNNVIGIPVQAYDAMPSGCIQATATATDSYIISNPEVAHLKANTDVLLVRHAATCNPGDGNCEADIVGKLYFQASRCATELSSATPYVLHTSNFDRTKRACNSADPADKRKFMSSIYYIRDYAVTAGDGIPTLMRSEFDLWTDGTTLAHKKDDAAAPPDRSQALISGIESFRVELGVDNISDDSVDILTGTPISTGIADAELRYTAPVYWKDYVNRTSPRNRGDGSPDSYVRCTSASPCTAAQLANVVTVKIYVLARAEMASPGYRDTKTYSLGTTTLGPFNDGFKRHVFSTTVRLNNVSGRRETP